MTGAGTKMREGNSYRFRIEKRIVMPDGEGQIVLKGPDGKKYLISAERFSSYSLDAGKEIVCRIDKINCKGEVFLEPENPYYSENRLYDFEVVEYREITGSRIREGKVMVVRSVTGHHIPVPVPPGKKMPEPGEKAELLVVRISKGRLHLATGNNELSTHHLDSETVYDFKVEGIETDIDGEEYFVVTDQLGVVHTIRRKYYEYYGLSEGVTFRGRVIRYREDGTRLIEPENPFYTPGQNIEITISRNEKNVADDSWYIAGKDKFGFNHELRVRKKVVGERLLCRVVMIRKGKPLLEPHTGGGNNY